VLNGVLMGLTRRDAQGRLDAVIEFAELEEFIDLKLKNYSSGMMVRLAFSVMVQADADIMLIDEVLAVGDAAFAQKCMDVFHKRREEGKTVVLVTHDMETVQSLCHRAMLLHEGKLVYIGDPEATALRYYRLNFAGIRSSSLGPGDDPSAVKDVNMDLLEATLRDEQGRPIENLEQDKPITIDLLLQAKRDLPNPIFVVWVRNAEHVVVFEFTRIMDGPVRAGERVRFSGPIENKLVPGRYYLDCWIRQDESDNVMALQALRAVNFVVYGTASRHGVVTVDAQIEPRLEQ
jgi:energy-coupling factor transporter ATP-binding protein EcfA2